jgi:AP-3 complex subunit delta-1
MDWGSELADPHKLIQYLLDQDIVRLPPDILALYIQAVMKIFGYWATELAQRWNDADLPQVKALVDLIMSRLKDFVSSPHVEVQERVRPILSLTKKILLFLKPSQQKRRPTRSNYSPSSYPTSSASPPDTRTPPPLQSTTT